MHRYNISLEVQIIPASHFKKIQIIIFALLSLDY